MRIITQFIFLIFYHQCSQVDIFAYGNYLFSNIAFDVLVKNDSKFMNMDNLKIKRKSRNETHKLYGSFEIFQDIKEDIQLRIEVYIKQGGEYRITPYHLKGSFCSIIATNSVFYISVSAETGLSKTVSRKFNFQ